MRGYELNDKQIDTIRKLTVLSEFEGMKVIMEVCRVSVC